MKLRVEVTADHIRRGEQGSPGHCPIALALQPLMAAGFEPLVGAEAVVFCLSGNAYHQQLRALLPLAGRRFVTWFDVFGPDAICTPTPVVFDLDIPDEILARQPEPVVEVKEEDLVLV